MVKHNAKFIRTALRGLTAFAALGCFQIANAAYADLKAPTGYKTTVTGSATYAAQKTDIPSALERIVTKAEGAKITLGTTEVRIPASIKYSPAARRVAAAVIFANPYLRTAAGIASWLSVADVVWDAASDSFRTVQQPSSDTGSIYEAAGIGRFSDPVAATIAHMRGQVFPNWVLIRPATSQTMQNGNLRVTVSFGPAGQTLSGDTYIFDWYKVSSGNLECPPGYTSTQSGCISPALTQPELADELYKKPMPSSVPLELPFPTDLPIDKSATKVNPTTGTNPDSQTYRQPTGDPVPIPNTDPVQYRKPYVDIVPSPTADTPWRVDIRPGESTSTDPKPADDPDKPPDNNDTPTEEKDIGLCDKYPEILACAKVELDVPDGEIPKATKELTYTPEAFGGGSCPADLYSSVGGQTIKVYDWVQTCGVVTTYLRPIIILLGAMGALFILIPGRD